MRSFTNYRLLAVGLVIFAVTVFGAQIINGMAIRASSPGAALARDMVVEWKQVIGIIQAGNTVGSGTGKVTGGGAPWTTRGGSAEVNLSTGRLQFQVQGLVLAGGNAIGTPDNVTMVKGTLVCDTTGTANGNSTLVDTPLVPLSAQGDAKFRGDLGTLPLACVNEPNLAFLMRTGGGAWLANCAVRSLESE